MVGWPHWHVIIWGRLVVNWILEKVFSLLDRVFFIFFKVGKNLSPFWGIFIDNNSKKLYVDNGAPYSNKQLSLILGSLGIIEIHAPVRDGAAKTKVERTFRTIKDTWLNGFDPSGVESLEELNRLLADYVRKRNTSINRSIGETPMERYSLHINRIRFPKSREWLDECFMNRTIRKVNNDSTVSIDSVLYDVPMHFIRMKVEIRYLPDDMKNAYILYDSKRYYIRPTNKLENSRTKRENIPVIDYSMNGGLKDV